MYVLDQEAECPLCPAPGSVRRSFVQYDGNSEAFSELWRLGMSSHIENCQGWKQGIGMGLMLALARQMSHVSTTATQAVTHSWTSARWSGVTGRPFHGHLTERRPGGKSKHGSWASTAERDEVGQRNWTRRTRHKFSLAWPFQGRIRIVFRHLQSDLQLAL
jgi:hypothetical protein